MSTELPPRDPIGAQQRKAAAARRVGKDARCACGEARPEALIATRRPIVCAACKRRSEGKTTTDKHHFAGRANGPITVSVPVNDHWAVLNSAQYDWPQRTRENPDGSPLIAASGHIRGFADVVLDLIKRGLRWIADMLERLDEYLAERLGPKWWLAINLQDFLARG